MQLSTHQSSESTAVLVGQPDLQQETWQRRGNTASSCCVAVNGLSPPPQLLLSLRGVPACVTQIDDRVCEGGQEVEISLSRMRDDLLEQLGSTQVRLGKV